MRTLKPIDGSEASPYIRIGFLSGRTPEKESKGRAPGGLRGRGPDGGLRVDELSVRTLVRSSALDTLRQSHDGDDKVVGVRRVIDVSRAEIECECTWPGSVLWAAAQAGGAREQAAEDNPVSIARRVAGCLV